MSESWLHVSAKSLLPVQQHTPVRLLRSVNAYLQHGVKYPFIATFHSYAEFISGLLLEAEPCVSNWVPQPFRLRLGKTSYTPDVYFVRGGQQVVREIKSAKQIDAWSSKYLKCLKEFFSFHEMMFDVVTNDTILEQERLALHYLPIIQTVSQGRMIDTRNQERLVVEQLEVESPLPLHHFIDPTDREGSANTELALFRLLLRGKIQADLSFAPLDYRTEFFYETSLATTFK